MQNNKTFELANFSTFIEQPKSLKLFAMLQFLKIRNLALMDAIELEFDGGFNVVTGETGAGKSVLLGALAILSPIRFAEQIGAFIVVIGGIVLIVYGIQCLISGVSESKN